MDRTLINNDIKDRNITRLCHITRSQKAMHILTCEDGIKAVDFLDKSIYDANDPLRLDGKTDFINCSIQYPNHWYWNKVKNKEPLFKEGVILLINPEILLLETTQFCPFNAARGRGAYINKGYDTFRQLYSNRIDGRSRTINMLSCCPTDDQAEVLVYRNISRKDIIGIVVEDEDRAESESIRYSMLENVPKLDIFIAPDLFNGDWSKKIRQGEKPLERKYQGSEL